MVHCSEMKTWDHNMFVRIWAADRWLWFKLIVVLNWELLRQFCIGKRIWKDIGQAGLRGGECCNKLHRDREETDSVQQQLSANSIWVVLSEHPQFDRASFSSASALFEDCIWDKKICILRWWRESEDWSKQVFTINQPNVFASVPSTRSGEDK